MKVFHFPWYEVAQFKWCIEKGKNTRHAQIYPQHEHTFLFFGGVVYDDVIVWQRIPQTVEGQLNGDVLALI